jgi:serine/threonine protein kinase
MSPELFRVVPGADTEEKCDVYSFGVLLWECITGRVPWWGAVQAESSCCCTVNHSLKAPGFTTLEPIREKLV